MYLKTLLVFAGTVLFSMGVGAFTSPYHITDVQFKPGRSDRRLGSFTFSFVNLNVDKDKIITCDWRGATVGPRGSSVPNEWITCDSASAYQFLVRGPLGRNAPLDLYIFHKGAEVVAPSIECWSKCIPISKQEIACKKSGKIEGVGVVEMYPTIPVTDAVRKELEAESGRDCGRRLVLGGRPVPFGGP